MKNIASHYLPSRDKSLFRKARILSFDKTTGTAGIYCDDLSGIQELHATLAVPYPVDLIRDDQVLISGNGLDEIFIIGILSAKSPPAIQAENGSFATLTGVGEQSRFRIFSKDSELILEYAPDSRKTIIAPGKGDLEIRSPEGDIRFQTEADLILDAETVRINGRKSFEATVRSDSRDEVSTLSISPGRTKLSSPDLRVAAESGSLFIDRLKIAGKKLFGALHEATVNLTRLETKTETLITKAENSYQTVDNLTQLKTGRMKTLVRTSYHLKSKNSVLKTEDDFKVKAERIDLG